MDGATNELAAAGYGRRGELKAEAERAAKRWAEQLVDWLAAEKRGVFRHVEHALRGLPASSSDWPEWLWERFCDEADADITERELFAMRAPFCADAALTLDYYDIDCR